MLLDSRRCTHGSPPSPNRPVAPATGAASRPRMPHHLRRRSALVRRHWSGSAPGGPRMRSAVLRGRRGPVLRTLSAGGDHLPAAHDLVADVEPGVAAASGAPGGGRRGRPFRSSASTQIAHGIDLSRSRSIPFGFGRRASSRIASIVPSPGNVRPTRCAGRSRNQRAPGSGRTAARTAQTASRRRQREPAVDADDSRHRKAAPHGRHEQRVELLASMH